jgi:ribosomal protein S27AE
MGRPLLKTYETAIVMYNGGLSIGEVANIFGLSRQAMWDILRRRGVQFRPQKRFGSDNTFHRGGRTNGKKQARQAMQIATDKGIIRRGTVCEQCGDGGVVEGHHDDYNKPLSVRWLCKRCHFEWHKSNKAIALRA